MTSDKPQNPDQGDTPDAANDAPKATPETAAPKPKRKPAARFDHAAAIAQIPKSPGVYIMKDKKGKIVYIGKSVNLKARVRSYFSGSDSRAFVKRLPKILSEIDFIVAPSEKDALILEARMILAHQPRYNVLLREEKFQLYIRLDLKAPWPWIELTRWVKKDGARYFGPYTSMHAIRHALHVLNRYFKLRTCPDSVLNNRTRPCLQYQIKRCLGPCVLPVERATYMEHVQEAILFLEGRQPELKDRLHARMMEASDALEFEQAAHYRDQLKAMDTALQGERITEEALRDQDALGLYREGDRVALHLLFVRRGKLESARPFFFKDQEAPDAEVCASFLTQYYMVGNRIPDEVLLPLELSDAAALGELLTELKGRKVFVRTPSKGPRLKLVETASVNAKHAFHKQHDDGHHTTVLERLQKRLQLSQTPHRIECFDISNFQGAPIVGSMVVFEDGQPAKHLYRTFKVRTVHEQDDFASMYEVLTRRFERTVHDDWPKPDLVVIDGGKGQLNQAVAVLNDLGIHGVDVVGLAKSRVASGDDASPAPSSEAVERSMERVFLPGRKNPVILRQNSAELYLLQRARDEAHRCAITFHRRLRRQKTLKSTLDEIPGVGPSRRKALLKHFGSLAKIRDADLPDLARVPGISHKLARQIFAFFHSAAGLDEDSDAQAEA